MVFWKLSYILFKFNFLPTVWRVIDTEGKEPQHILCTSRQSPLSTFSHPCYNSSFPMFRSQSSPASRCPDMFHSSGGAGPSTLSQDMGVRSGVSRIHTCGHSFSKVSGRMEALTSCCLSGSSKYISEPNEHSLIDFVILKIVSSWKCQLQNLSRFVADLLKKNCWLDALIYGKRAVTDTCDQHLEKIKDLVASTIVTLMW